MVDTIVETLVTFFKDNIPAELVAFFISLCPVLEIRGGMIAARLLEIEFVKAFIICYIGNMIPIPFILLFIRRIFKWMRKYPKFAKIVDKLEARSDKKKDTIIKYQEWGLLIFVAVPLPGTGGWTGALIAALMDLRFKKCLPIIALGVFIAGIIMSLITYGIF